MADTIIATDDQKARAAIAYVLTWITGLIIFFTAKKEERYVRWHAVQSIALGIAYVIVQWVLGLLGLFAGLGMGPRFLFFGPLFSLSSLVFLLVVVLVVILAIKAYQGETVRLPVLADFADKYA